MNRIPLIQNGQQIGWEEFEKPKDRIQISPLEFNGDIFSGLRDAMKAPLTLKKEIEKEPNYGRCDRSCCRKIIDKNKAHKSYQPFNMKGIELWFCSKECQDGWYANMQG